MLFFKNREMDCMVLKRLPSILIIIIIASAFLHPIIPYDTKRMIYAISLTIKSAVLFLLPFLIFGLLFKTFVRLSHQAAHIFFLIFGCLCVSNFLNTFLSHYVGSLLYHVDFSLGNKLECSASLEPYFLFLIPSLIKNDFALLGGVVVGLGMVIYNRAYALKISQKVNFIIEKLFSVISFLTPLFIVGLVIKCASEGNLLIIFKNYLQVLLVIITYGIVYTFIFYLVANKFSIQESVFCLRNMFPAWLTAMGTMSSALTMPVTILSTEKNVTRKELAGSVVSATVNIHLLGDCIAIPIISYAILKYYGIAEPSLGSYLVFALFFVIAKFSVAAIPAGGIIVMVPILEKYLNFTPEMSTLIVAIYVVFDPIITGFNVLGNGAFAKLIDTLAPFFSLRKRV
ncbi:MAG: dicarboxylate/amino acid:cation symporter [Holosporales bacterium]|jgi:Na+/H+-dicarboxylate symporter|nr:dicarboxylate/amino acid:cation symporter [Holosporales bacterium]